MRRSGKDQRLSLFNRGNNRCPICLAGFTKESVEKGDSVTLEHVPPKSLSPTSRRMCLTCADCNEGAGRGIDYAAYLAVNEPKATVEIAGVLHSAVMTYDSDRGFDLSVPYLRVPPSAMYELGKEDFRVKFAFPNPHFAFVSWLKSAYLSLFSLLGKYGYRYAEGTAASLIREQIMDPKHQIIECCIASSHPESRVLGDWVARGRPEKLQ